MFISYLVSAEMSQNLTIEARVTLLEFEASGGCEIELRKKKTKKKKNVYWSLYKMSKISVLISV